MAGRLSDGLREGLAGLQASGIGTPPSVPNISGRVLRGGVNHLAGSATFGGKRCTLGFFTERGRAHGVYTIHSFSRSKVWLVKTKESGYTHLQPS